jgi:hypothetical protein
MTEENQTKDIEAFVTQLGEINNLEDARKLIRVLTMSNNSLVMIASECVAHLAADKEGAINHAHGEECPVTTMLTIMEDMGVCYKTSEYTWQLRRESDKLN